MHSCILQLGHSVDGHSSYQAYFVQPSHTYFWSHLLERGAVKRQRLTSSARPYDNENRANTVLTLPQESYVLSFIHESKPGKRD